MREATSEIFGVLASQWSQHHQTLIPGETGNLFIKCIFETLAEPKKEVQIAASMALVQVSIIIFHRLLKFMSADCEFFLYWTGVGLCRFRIKRYDKVFTKIIKECKLQGECPSGRCCVLLREGHHPWFNEGLSSCTFTKIKILTRSQLIVWSKQWIYPVLFCVVSGPWGCIWNAHDR